MKRIRYIENEGTDDEETYLYFVAELSFLKTNNQFFSTFLRIQFDKGLITFKELLEILNIEDVDNYDLIDW